MSYLTHNRIVVLIASLFMSANAGAMHHGKGLKPVSYTHLTLPTSG